VTRTTVVTVSWNTCELTALLLWSLRRVDVDAGVVVVDNGSTDGSVAMLRTAAEAGRCTLLVNERNVGHGPALDQALASLRGVGGRVWVLDSDCVVARAGVLDALPRGAAVVGERSWDRWHERDR
jgi:GT2 family glycosyltransferase